ncbi:hypothetical protein [Streptomyces violascens]|uniref:hypothetical protein n=1 Tax=Streptomyces violascens TaxID=67381 RepID=UPI0016754E00|nr:hypothetical protein [Streptomyces violascens]GGU44799.1 hypothetical protein GCM10010289_76750 [Streptomyces violascens]
MLGDVEQHSGLLTEQRELTAASLSHARGADQTDAPDIYQPTAGHLEPIAACALLAALVVLP